MRAFAFIVAGALGVAGAAQAATPPDPEFPILGGSFGQIMRVTVSATPPDPCRVAVRFHTGLTSPPEPDRLLDLAPGQVGATDLDLSRLAPRFGVRIEVQPIVGVLAGRCSASVETFEVFTRRTTAYVRLFTGLASPPDPDVTPPEPDSPPDPNFAPIAVALGQIVRLGLTTSPPDPNIIGDVNLTPPDPCRGTLAFFDARGLPVGAPIAFDLLPGEFAFATLDPRSMGSAVPSPRTIVQPRVMPDGAGSLAGCHASVQVFDAATGWTTEAVAGR